MWYYQFTDEYESTGVFDAIQTHLIYVNNTNQDYIYILQYWFYGTAFKF